MFFLFELYLLAKCEREPNETVAIIEHNRELRSYQRIFIAIGRTSGVSMEIQTPRRIIRAYNAIESGKTTHILTHFSSIKIAEKKIHYSLSVFVDCFLI